MAPMKLNVRISGTDAFEAEIDNDETVEALSVVLFSMRPDLGEELRLVFKGRLLREDQMLREAGLVENDVIAVAKKKIAPSPPAASTSAVAAPPVAAPPAAASSLATATSIERSPAAPPAPAHTEVPSAVKSASDASSVTGESGYTAPEAPATAPAPAPQEEVPGLMEQGAMLRELVKAQEAEEPAAAQASSPTSKPSPIETQKKEEVDCSPEGLLALATRLENAAGEPVHGEVIVEALRGAAARMEKMDGAIQNLAQGLSMVNMLSGHALQGLGAKEVGPKSPQNGYSPDAHPGASETRSFMLKKGDADIQEAHRAAAMLRPSTGSGIIGGGTLSDAASKPMTREEMDRARRARLEQLEAQQKEKKREKEEADEKGRSREAMFNRPTVGAAKPLGKH